MGKGIVKLGEGNWAVKDGNLLAAKETNGRFKNAEFTVDRGTDATYVGRDGLIVNETGDDTPRIDFTDNTDGHLLLEPESRNLFDYSEDFSTSNWIKNGIDIDYGHQSPTGLNTATKIAATHADPYIYKSVSVTQNQTYTFSFYCKGESSSVGKTARVLFWYGLGTAAGSMVSHEFNLTSGWERIQFQTTPTGSGTLYFRIDIPANSSEIGDVAYLWGAQLEELPYATSYIPTNGSTVTRDAETCTGAGETADFNSEEGVLYAEIAALANDGTSRRISLSDGSVSNRVSLELDETTNRIKAFISSGGVSHILRVTASDLTQYNKVAIKYKDNDFALWLDGVERETDVSGSVPIGLNTLEFAQGSGSQKFYGKCKSIRVYKEALSDTDLENLTS